MLKLSQTQSQIVLLIAWLVEAGLPMTPLAGTALGFLFLAIAGVLAIALLWNLIRSSGDGVVSVEPINKVSLINSRLHANRFVIVTPTLLLIGMAVIWSYLGGLPALKASKITASIDRIHLIDAEKEEGPKVVMALFVISLVNRGAPNFADWQSMTVITPQGEELAAENVIVPDFVSVRVADKWLSYFGSDALYKKTFEQPMQDGKMIRGVLQFRIRNVFLNSIAQPGTRFRVSYRDADAKTNYVEYIWPSKLDMIPGPLPGIRMQYGEVPS